MTELKEKSTTLSLNRSNLSCNKSRTVKAFKRNGLKVFRPKLSVKDLEKKEKAEKSLKTKKALAWLIKTFPLSFNKNKIVLLSIGIRKEIMQEHKLAGGSKILGFGLNPVKRALRNWTTNLAYLNEASKKQSVRYDLSGSKSGNVTDHEREYSKIERNEIYNKKNTNRK